MVEKGRIGVVWVLWVDRNKRIFEDVGEVWGMYFDSGHPYGQQFLRNLGIGLFCYFLKLDWCFSLVSLF